MTKIHRLEYDNESRRLTLSGEWDLVSLNAVREELNQIHWPTSGKLIFEGANVTKMDTSGAWLINEWLSKLKKSGISVELQGFTDRYVTLLQLVDERIKESDELPKSVAPGFLANFGMVSSAQLLGFYEYLSFVGLLALESLRLITHPRHLRWSALAGVIYRVGYSALPIIALLSFMIGVVITYQMGLQLKNYGANIFIVDLLGLAILREFGPLITAIMVAGRSGSAFTAQLGMMKLNQEIDALDTMGVTPSELLLLPRIAGLVVALPLLTIWADILGVFGGMIMSSSMLSISWYDFLERFPSVIPLRALMIGLGKAPVFALIIASVGCYEGMKVKGGANSVGTNTTRSVVLAIFFIIVADAIFSIILSELKL